MEKPSGTEIISEFTIDNINRSYYHHLKSLGKLLPKGKAMYFNKCKLIATDNKLITRIDGSEFYVQSNPTKPVIVEVFYQDLKVLIEAERNASLFMQIQERTLIINGKKISCNVKNINESEFHLEAGLGALNFGEVNTEIPSWQKEIFRIKSTGQEFHISALRKDAELAALLLKKYKVDANKILHLIMERFE